MAYKRTTTAAFDTEIDAANEEPIILVEIQWKDGTVNLWTGIGDKSWDGKTWTGAGTLLGISQIEETGESKSNGITLTLSGIDTADINLAQVSDIYGRTALVYFGFLDSSGAVVIDPILWFKGVIDKPNVFDSAGTSIISIRCDSEYAHIFIPNDSLWTDDEQQAEFPGDNFFEFLIKNTTAQFPWGKQTDAMANVPGHPGIGGGRGRTRTL